MPGPRLELTLVGGEGGREKLGLLHAVGELEGKRHDHPHDEFREKVGQQDGPPSVAGDHGEYEGPTEEQRLADDEAGEFHAVGPTDLLAAHFAGDGGQYVVEVPLDTQHAVEGPDVERLDAVEFQPALAGGESAPRVEVDVVVEARDVRVGVVDDVVLDAPYVAAAANQIHGMAHHQIHPFVAGKGVVVGVVGDVETDGGHGSAE